MWFHASFITVRSDPQTEMQVTRLEQGFELPGEEAQAKKCNAMEGTGIAFVLLKILVYGIQKRYSR
jgi:hypothetical protein